MRWDAIRVEPEQGWPRRFCWRRRWYQITAIQEVWQDAGEWWIGESPRWFFRVSVNGGLFELATDPHNHQWWLYRVFD
ncbi:MAG: DUF6504 family protein [Gemmataceae bacterium]